MTSDTYQFIVNDYEVLESAPDADSRAGSLQIGDTFYAPTNNAKYCGDSLVTAIKIYLTEWHILHPTKDILSLKEATDYMTEINKMAKQLYDLKR